MTFGRTIKELASAVDPAVKRAEGMVRRVVASIASAKATWQFTGFRQLDGANEVFNAEVFTGAGFYSRPAGTIEAIVINVGDGKVPVAIAVRDEKTRAAIAGALAADETAVFNSQAILHFKADGAIEARSKEGVAKRLVTVDDLEALRAVFIAWTGATAGDLKAALTTLIGTPPYSWPDGTTVLKGE